MSLFSFRDDKRNRTGASLGTFFTVSGTARMVPAEAPKMLIGSKQSVPVDKTLKAALLSILNNVEGNSAKSNVFASSKSWKVIAVEYLIFQKFFGLWGFNRSFSYFDLEWYIHILFTAWILECYDLRTSKMIIEHIFTAYFHLALNEEPTSERTNPTDSLNVHCTRFFRQENKRCAAS